jgi:hypothetical protein
MGRTIVAVNTAPTSENRMHGEAATDYGFRGGLVPGVDVLGYVVDAALDRWGAAWLEHGRLAGRLVQPVYDGESVEVVATVDDDATVARVQGPDGDVRADVRLSSLDADASGIDVDFDDLAVAVLPEPDDRLDATAERLTPGTTLGTQYAHFRADRATGYLAEISEADPVFADRGVAHPGWLLRFSNWALSQTVQLGPWIHVASDLQLVGAVHDGDQLEVRARVTDRFEKKGHELVVLQVGYLVDGSPVARCEHTAIWRPRREG